MRYIVAAATAFALVAGIALGLVVSRGLDGSASAAPPTQAVKEQNLDGSGFIAVHEQGVADVNVLSIPSQAAPTGRLIELAIASDGYSPFADVSDCSLVSILGRGGYLSLNTFASPDGTTRVGASLVGVQQNSDVGGLTSSIQNVQVALPYLQVKLNSASGTAWIWCVP